MRVGLFLNGIVLSWDISFEMGKSALGAPWPTQWDVKRHLVVRILVLVDMNGIRQVRHAIKVLGLAGSESTIILVEVGRGGSSVFKLRRTPKSSAIIVSTWDAR
jgi:hypothetical protein